MNPDDAMYQIKAIMDQWEIDSITHEDALGQISAILKEVIHD